MDKMAELFDPELIKSIDLKKLPNVSFDPPISVENFGDSLCLRPLCRNDFGKGFPAILSQLTVLGDVTEEQFLETFDKMAKCPNTYYINVIEDKSTETIIGSATLLIEQKFIHNCAKRARIEDVVVSDDYRGKQLGKLLLTALVILGKNLGCYKISLDCRDKMIPFYETFGFSKEPENANFMTIRY